MTKNIFAYVVTRVHAYKNFHVALKKNCIKNIKKIFEVTGK